MAMMACSLILLGATTGFHMPAVRPYSLPGQRPALSAQMMAGMPLPAGSLVALVTPMKDDGTVDIPCLRKLLQWHVSEGTNGIVVLGTTGEASTLSDDERAEVLAATREEIGGKLPIIVGTGTISTTDTIAMTKQAKLFGADAALIVTPYYVKPTQAGLIKHFTTIADASDLPIVLYNVPGRTGVDLSVETTIVLSRHPMIRGLKDATGDNTRVAPMRAVCDDEFKLYSGARLSPRLSHGGAGTAPRDCTCTAQRRKATGAAPTAAPLSVGRTLAASLPPRPELVRCVWQARMRWRGTTCYREAMGSSL
jgi:hypothetical protein